MSAKTYDATRENAAMLSEIEQRNMRPSQRLSAAQIERAAEALRDYEHQHVQAVMEWKHLNEKIKQHFRGKVRVVVDAVGGSMSAMVERVARVLCRFTWETQFGKQDLDACVDQEWPNHTDAARLSIAAMREPPQAIMDVLENEGWDAAIDEALK